MMYNNRKVKKFLNLLARHSNEQINYLVENNTYESFREVDPEIKKEDLKPSEKEQSYNSVKEEILRLENKLQRVKNKKNDQSVKRLERNIERLKGKIKRLDKPKDL